MTGTAPAKTAAKSPAPFDPAAATWVNEKLCGGTWRQSFHCPSRTTPAIYTLTCDPDGGRACCSCPAYVYRRDDAPACLHTRAAAAIVARTAADLYALFSLAELAMLDRDMRRQYGEAGLRGNVRYGALGTMIGARIAQQDVPATIARGKAAIAQLYGESA